MQRAEQEPPQALPQVNFEFYSTPVCGENLYRFFYNGKAPRYITNKNDAREFLSFLTRIVRIPENGELMQRLRGQVASAELPEELKEVSENLRNYAQKLNGHISSRERGQEDESNIVRPTPFSITIA